MLAPYGHGLHQQERQVRQRKTAFGAGLSVFNATYIHIGILIKIYRGMDAYIRVKSMAKLVFDFSRSFNDNVIGLSYCLCMISY